MTAIDLGEVRARKLKRSGKGNKSAPADYGQVYSMVAEESKSIDPSQRNDVNLKAEEGVSYALMHEPALYSYITEKVRLNEFFYYERARKLLDSLLDLAVQSGEVDRLDVSQLTPILKKKGYYGSGEGQVDEAYVMEVYGSDTYNPAYVRTYIDNLKELAARRQAKLLMTAGLRVLEDVKVSPLDVKASLEARLFELERLMLGYNDESGFVAFDDEQFILDSEAQRRKEEARKGRPTPITGIKCVDGVANTQDLGKVPMMTLSFGKVATVMSRTGGFKSTFVTQTALESAIQRGCNIWYGTTELGVDELRLRMISYLSHIPAWRLEDALSGMTILSNDEKEAYEAYSRALTGELVQVKKNGRYVDFQIPGRINFFSVNGHGADWFTREAIAKNINMARDERFHRRGIDLFILDQIQDMGPSEDFKSSNTAEMIANNMRWLKLLAIKSDTPIIVVSHVATEQCDRSDEWGIIPTEYSAFGSREPVKKSQYTLGLAPDQNSSRLRIELLKAGTRQKGQVRFADIDASSYSIY